MLARRRPPDTSFHNLLKQSVLFGCNVSDNTDNLNMYALLKQRSLLSRQNLRRIDEMLIVRLIACLCLVTTVAMADETPKVEVGKPAPDFTVTGIDRKTFKLSDKLAAGDKNIVLLFSRANW